MILRRSASLLLLALLPACSVVPRSLVGVRASVDVASMENELGIQPTLRTRLYRMVDENTADVILTDLSLEQLTSESAPPPTGYVFHVQLFIRPLPGRTPIADTACSATVRFAVLARGEAGIYVGGGFLLPSGPPGEELFGGSMSQAPVRIDHKTQRFEDRLGTSHAAISFTARRDDDAVTSYLNYLDRLALVSEKVHYADTMIVPGEAAPKGPEASPRATDTELPETPESP